MLGGQFFVVSSRSGSGAVPYSIMVLVNGVEVATVASTDPQLVQEVTAHLMLGENTVEFRVVRGAGSASGNARAQPKTSRARAHCPA